MMSSFEDVGSSKSTAGAALTEADGVASGSSRIVDDAMLFYVVRCVADGWSAK